VTAIAKTFHYFVKKTGLRVAIHFLKKVCF
jgi:hypothetical protein